jgi:Papain family cysteine protease
MSHTFDWAPNHDPRSRDYPLRAALSKAVRVRPRMWRQGTVLDQGSEGACVGFGWTAELLAKPSQPVRQPTAAVGENKALEIYRAAKAIDEWEGEDYSGTSVLAGAKIVKAAGYIGEYRWCFGIADVRDAVLMSGPVVIGIPWYDEMYETRASGLVNVGGTKVGGHCITITGYHPSANLDGKIREVFRWRNSWGKTYGIKGSGFIQSHHLAALLEDGGEACVPMSRSTSVVI